MSATRVVFAIARADFRERVRRYHFLVTLVVAVFLAYAAATGKILLKLGPYRGLYTSGWIGVMVALVTTTFESLIGFYVVKDALDRDRHTGVGEILATTPLSKPSYAIGKFLSNFAVLTAIVVVLALGAIVILMFDREDPRIDLWALLSPFLLLALPAMAVTAALALLFETLPLLRGGVGNVLWFFLWSFGLALPAITNSRWLDASGLWTAADGLMELGRRVIPGYRGEFSLTISDRAAVPLASLRWDGLRWTAQQVLWRIGWVGIAVAVALLAAACFDRFDPSRSTRAASPHRPSGTTDAEEPRAERQSPGWRAETTDLVPVWPQRQLTGLGRMFRAELRVALSGLSWWWYAVVIGFVIAQLFAPLEIARGPLLAFAWMWPVFVWSAMGTRESRYGTEGILFSSPRILSRQLPMSLLAGLAVGVVSGSGTAVRLLMTNDPAGVMTWIAGVLFVCSLALSLGVWTGTSKAYEGLYTVLWYLGPINHVPALDYTGAANGARTVSHAMLYFGLAALLLLSALTRRAVQVRQTR